MTQETYLVRRRGAGKQMYAFRFDKELMDKARAAGNENMSMYIENLIRADLERKDEEAEK